MTVPGVVLTGGASRRMGRNKALIRIDGTPLADRVAATLRRGGCEPVVAIGGDPELLAALEVSVLPDRRPGEGPLGGILDGLERWSASAPSDTGWMVAVACDLPDLTAGVVRDLTAAGLAAASGSVDVVVARTDRLEPTVAMWSLSASTAISEMYRHGERALHRVIDGLRYVDVAVDPAALRNVNTPEDLDRR